MFTFNQMIISDRRFGNVAISQCDGGPRFWTEFNCHGCFLHHSMPCRHLHATHLPLYTTITTFPLHYFAIRTMFEFFSQLWDPIWNYLSNFPLIFYLIIVFLGVLLFHFHTSSHCSKAISSRI